MSNDNERSPIMRAFKRLPWWGQWLINFGILAILFASCQSKPRETPHRVSQSDDGLKVEACRSEMSKAMPNKGFRTLDNLCEGRLSRGELDDKQ